MTPIPEAAKAYVALIGAVATALLGVFAADTQVGQVLTVIAVVATAVATFAVPNRPSIEPERPSLFDERGAVTLTEVVLVIVGIAALLWLLDALRVVNLG